MKSRGLEPVTCRVYGPLHETVIFSKPLNKLVTSTIRSLLADANTFFCSDEIPEKGQHKKGAVTLKHVQKNRILFSGAEC